MTEIDRLMDAQPNTPQGDQLDILVTLIEAWEQTRFPIGKDDFPFLLPKSKK